MCIANFLGAGCESLVKREKPNEQAEPATVEQELHDIDQVTPFCKKAQQCKHDKKLPAPLPNNHHDTNTSLPTTKFKAPSTATAAGQQRQPRQLLDFRVHFAKQTDYL